MDSIWGIAEQYNPVIWHWPIAIYLFLAGLSAGSIMVSLLVKWNKHEDEQVTIWDAMVKAGAILAPLTIIIGLLLLIVDLKKPLEFYWLLISYNFQSVMTLGVLALFVYTPMALLFTLLIFEDTLRKTKMFSFLMPIVDLLKSFRNYSKILEYSLFVVAIIVGAYTGFLLSVIQANPMWNTPVLPLLFLASGVSAGIAANILVGITFFKNSINKESIKYLLIMDLRVIMVELPIIALLFIGMMYSGGESLIAAKQALTTGMWATIFWIGVIGIGLLLPVVIAFTALKNHAYKVGYIVFNSFVVLLGVLLLRFYIVYAGQLFVGA